MTGPSLLEAKKCDTKAYSPQQAVERKLHGHVFDLHLDRFSPLLLCCQFDMNLQTNEEMKGQNIPAAMICLFCISTTLWGRF